MSRLYTEVRGSGPALVLLHGWGLNVRVWDGLAAQLCDLFRIIAVDLPGHGRSGWLAQRSSLAQQAAQVRDTVAGIAADYALLGWSLGGQIALQLAADQPAAGVRRLALIAVTPRLVAAEDWPHGAAPARLAQQAADLESDYRRTVSEFLELQVRGSASGAAALDELRAALFAHGFPAPAALARDLDLLRETDLRPRLAAIAVPTLVIAGQYDRVTLPAASQALADALPEARYVEIRRAAHAPFLSHLGELSTLVRDFLLRA